MGRVLAIAQNTFREAIRNRIMYIVLVFAILMILSTFVIKDLTIDAHSQVIRHVGLFAINFFAIVIAVLVGIGLVYNELDKRTIYTIVSKPIDRWQFLLGKYLGLLLTLYIITLVMTGVFIATTWWVNHQGTDFEAVDRLTREHVETRFGTPRDEVEDNLTLRGDLGASDEQIAALVDGLAVGLRITLVEGDAEGLETIGDMEAALARRAAPEPHFAEATLKSIKAVSLGCLELAIIVAFALLFSSFSTPTLSGFMTMMVIIAGRLNEDIERFAQNIVKNVGGEPEQATSLIGGFGFLLGESGAGEAVKFALAKIAALLAPNFEILDGRAEAVHFDTLDINRLNLITVNSADAVLYAVPYTAAVLLVAMFLFSRRNFR